MNPQTISKPRLNPMIAGLLLAAIVGGVSMWISLTPVILKSRPLHNLADHPAEARIMLILSRFA